MTADIRFLLSLSILIPVATGILRFKKLPQGYYPVIALIIAGLLNEILIHYLFSFHPIFNNIFFLLEFVLLCMQLRNWKNILTTKWIFYSLIGAATLWWIIDELILMKILGYKSLLLIFFPFVLVLLTTRQLSFIVAIGKTNILKNPVFVFCIAIILFYSYRVLSEIFYHYAPDGETKKNIFNIQAYVNVVFNIMLAIAILLVPKKGKLTY